MPKESDDSYLTRRLLSPPPPVPSTTEKVRIENEKDKMSEKSEPDADLRLHDAVCEGIDEVIELIEESPDLLFVKDDEQRTALHTLCISGDEDAPEILKVLLGVKEGDGKSFRVERANALHATDDKGRTPLHYAARNWFPALTEALLKYGAKPGAQDSAGNTPMHLCAEGNIESALDCAKVILQYDSADGSLINMKNLDEHSPMHRAVKEQAGEMVNLLLQKQYMLDLSALTSAKGQNILQYLCVEVGETEKSCEILKAIVKSCDPTQLNSADQDGRTVLHTAAIERLPQITGILVADDRVDVLKVDKRMRTALFYAAENGSYPDGYNCVERLISRKFPRTKIQIDYLFEMCDDLKNTAFMYACVNCPMDTMHKYLEAIREPQFWMSETNMTLVYKQCPLAIKGLMDAAFSERKISRSSADEIVTDFGPITGYQDPIEKLPQQETKYLKNALFWDYETQKEVLMHPLVQLFIVKKCKKLRSIIYSWIIWQFIWLTAYTLMALSAYTGVITSSTTAFVASIIILIYITISCINELFEFTSVGLTYILSVSNLFQWIQIGLGVAAIFPLLSGMVPTIATKNCAAIGVLLAYILSMRDIGKLHEEIGLVVEVLKQVVIQIVKVLLCCFPLLAGFTLSFVILFDDDDSLNTTFPGPLVKVLVMMTGEFEYNDTFKSGEQAGDTEAVTKNRAIRLLLFLSFLICVPVAFFNLLTGFALERVMELRERAKVGRIAKQLEHIHFIESILLSLSPLKKLLPHGRIVRLLRTYNVTTAMIDGDLKFETFIVEETQKKLDRRTAREKRLDICAAVRSIFGTELAPEVRHQIFVLASQQSHNKQK